VIRSSLIDRSVVSDPSNVDADFDDIGEDRADRVRDECEVREGLFRVSAHGVRVMADRVR